MARPKLARETKAAKGTLRPCREKAPQADFSELVKLPAPPADIGAYGKAFWGTVGSELVASGVMKNADLIAFETMCRSYDSFKTMEKKLTAGGKVSIADAVQDSDGKSLWRMFMQEKEACRKLMQDFGITPAARNRVSGKQSNGVNADIEKMKGLIGG